MRKCRASLLNSDILNQNIGGIIGTPIFAGGALTEVNFGRIDAFGSEFSLNWRDKIDQVKYNIGVNFGFNGNRVREWPQSAPSYIQENSVREGASTIFPTYGYKVWRGTSSGDGILRNSDDIENYLHKENRLHVVYQKSVCLSAAYVSVPCYYYNLIGV